MTSVPRLERGLSALIKLTNPKQPRKRLMIFNDQATAWYLLGDAIQWGFVTGIFTKGHLMFESGDWASYKQENNSNWREAEKLTFRLDQGVV